jgi:hypothetical protein
MDGKPGTKGKRKLAEEERADADLHRAGKPLPEWSLVSHSAEDLASLVDHARKQIQIAQLDHDQRLMRTMFELTERSCNNPGSVTQAELDALARPHNVNFWMTATPSRCYEAYSYLGQGGLEAAAFRNLSAPLVVIRPVEPVPAVGQGPQSPFARQSTPPVLSSAFPDLETFAAAACRDPEHVMIDVSYRGFLGRKYDVSNKIYDEDLAKQTVSRLGGCAGAVFNLLFGRIRAGQALWIDRNWVRTVVAASAPASGTVPGGNGGPAQSNPCQIGNDPFGCQRRR